jgi:hypothetical protein
MSNDAQVIASHIMALVGSNPDLKNAGILEIGNRGAYQKLFSGEGFLNFLASCNMQLQRDKLEAYAIESFNNDDYLNPVLATVAWGYIGLDVGPCRVFKLLSQKEQLHLNEKLKELRNNLLKEDNELTQLKQAYRWLKENLDGVSDVFASKILYILSVELKIKAHPVIIDRRVINSIAKISADLVNKYCRRDAANNVTSTPNRYINYCKDIGVASDLLNKDCAIPNEWKSSDIELVLFNWNGGTK